MSNGKLELMDILKEAGKTLFTNTRLVIVTFFSSIPLFCFLIYFELALQEIVSEIPKFFPKSFHDSDNFLRDIPHGSFYDTNSFEYKAIQLCLLYLFPYHLLDLFNTVMVITTSSKVYSGEKSNSLGDFIGISIEKTSMKRSLRTWLFVLLFSTGGLVGFTWVLTNYYTIPMSSFVDMFLALVYGSAFVVLTVKYCKWSATFNMALVLTVAAEDGDAEIYGIEAFALSNYYGRGNERRGMVLMLVFFVLGLALRLPCLVCGCSETSNGVIYTCLYSGLICMANVYKWVVCVVYSYDCKKRASEKKLDGETGREGA